MAVDKTLLREIKKANGDGTRQTRFPFLNEVRAVQKECSAPDVMMNFDEQFKRHSRAAIAVCLASTIYARSDRLEASTVRWAKEILKCWTNHGADVRAYAIDDNLHPCRIEEYAGSFIRLTTE